MHKPVVLIASLLFVYLISVALARSSPDVSGRTSISGSGFSLQQISPRDYGAKCNGVTDDTAAFRAAQSMAQTLGGATISLGGQGVCKIGTIYTISNNGWEFGSNLKLDGSVSGVLDDISHSRRTYAFQSANDFNENNLFLSQEDVVSSSASSYQKNGLYVRLFQLDPSSYTDSIENVDQVKYAKDAVGVESQVNIRPMNMSGRIYGYHSQATVDAQGDGNVNVAELELSNNGTYTPQAGHFNSKRVLHATCVGRGDCTEGIQLDGSAKFHIVIDSFQTALRPDGYFLYLGTVSSADLTKPPVFGVSRSGEISTSGGVDVTGGAVFDKLVITGKSILKGPVLESASDDVIASGALGAQHGEMSAGVTRLFSNVNRVVKCSNETALQLPEGAPRGESRSIIILNRSGRSCSVFPPTGGTIESGSTDSSVMVQDGTDTSFRSFSNLAWYR